MERWILPNWCRPSAATTSWSQLTDVTFVNPVKSNVWKIKEAQDDVSPSYDTAHEHQTQDEPHDADELSFAALGQPAHRLPFDGNHHVGHLAPRFLHAQPTDIAAIEINARTAELGSGTD